MAEFTPTQRLDRFIYSVREMEDIVNNYPNRFYIPGYGLRIPQHYKRKYDFTID